MREKITFVWDIHYRCNFRCPFCWFYGHWERLDKLNIYLSVKEWDDIWDRMYKRYGECHLMITGGEPFLYPNFIELIEALSKKYTIKITTNISGDIDTFARKINPERVCLDMNFHPLEAKLEPFIRKVLVLKKRGFSGGVCYLAYPPQMEKINYFKEKFEKEGINFALAAYWGEYGGKNYPQDYTDEDKEFIAPFLGDPDRIKYHLNKKKTKGKLCRSGYIYASIKANGVVSRCGTLSEKPIGNIFDENFKLFDEPLPCEAEYCPCDEYIWLAEKD